MTRRRPGTRTRRRRRRALTRATCARSRRTPPSLAPARSRRNTSRLRRDNSGTSIHGHERSTRYSRVHVRSREGGAQRQADRGGDADFCAVAVG